MKIRTLTAFTALLLCTALLAGCASTYNYDLNEYVTLGQYEGVEVSTSTIEEQLESTIDSFLESNSVTEEVERAAKEGDIVNIDYEGKIDGVAFSGGTAADQTITLGSAGFIEGFETGLEGVAAGETVDLKLKFPEDYGNEELNGKDVVFTVTVNTVSEKTIPELTDALVAERTDYSTVDEYKAEKRLIIKQNLAWEKVATAATVKEYPKKEVKSYYDSMVKNYESYASMFGVTLEAYVYQLMGITDMDTFTAQMIATAKSYCKNDMVSRLICEQKGIEMTNEDYDRIALMFAKENGLESVSDLEKSAGKDALKNNVILQLAIEFVGNSAVEAE